MPSGSTPSALPVGINSVADNHRVSRLRRKADGAGQVDGGRRRHRYVRPGRFERRAGGVGQRVERGAE